MGAATVTATYVKHGPSWRVLIRPANAKRVSRVVDTESEAIELVRHFNRLGLAGVDIAQALSEPKPDHRTTYPPLRTAVPAFLEEQMALGNIRASTARAYRLRLARWAWPLIGDVPWNRLTREEIGGAILAIRRAGKTIATIGQVQNPLSTFYQWQQNVHGYRGPNPAADLRFFVGKHRSRSRAEDLQWFRREEARRLLDACRELQPRWWAFLMVSFGAGTRWGETAALMRSDIDWTRQRLHIRRTWSDPVQRLEPCKDGDARWVKVTPGVLAALTGHLEAMDLDAGLKRWSPEARELVFPNGFGRIGRYQTFHERVWCPLLGAARLPYRTPHAMRHTYATWMLEEGADLRWVRDQLGHASIQQTEGTYGHLERERHERRVDLDTILANSEGNQPRPPASTDAEHPG
jgi:integrase